MTVIPVSYKQLQRVRPSLGEREYVYSYASCQKLSLHVIQNRRRSTQVPAVLGKSIRFSKLKSSQYLVLMTQKPRKGDFRFKIQKISWQGMPLDPKEACTFAARLRNRSVFILDPHAEANKVPVGLFADVFLAVIVLTHLRI